jgi:subtilisin family serine protease
MRPDVINNSWGAWEPDYCDTSGAYAPTFEALRAADIFIAFAAGNVGDWVTPPHCSASTAPANTVDDLGNPLTFASGAHGSDGSLDYYSSGGPNACNRDKLFPDLASPGLGSCTAGLNSSYTCSFGGTSAASPHTAGCAALVRQASPGLSVVQVEQILRDADDDVDDTGCGGTADWNNSYGEGWLDCYEAIVNAGGGYDIPWLWLDPVSGTVPILETLPVSVTFDATLLAPGIYTGTLRMLHNDPLLGKVEVPVTLHVDAPYHYYLPLIMSN